MMTRILGMILLSFLFVSCGNDVRLSSNKLESYNQVTNAAPLVVNKTGTLIRKNISSPVDKIAMGGQTFTVSKYSSQIALSAIASRAEGIQVPVKFKGDVSGGEILLELLEFQ